MTGSEHAPMSQITLVGPALKLDFQSAREELSAFSRQMWKQPSSVKLCTYITRHDEAQMSNCREKKKKNMLLSKEGLNFFCINPNFHQTSTPSQSRERIYVLYTDLLARLKFI